MSVVQFSRADRNVILGEFFPSLSPDDRVWSPRPGQLVSLWDMLRFEAHAFVRLMASLNRMEPALERISDVVRRFERLTGNELRADGPTQLGKFEGDEKAAELAASLRTDLREMTEATNGFLGELGQSCRELRLELTSDQVRRVRELVEGSQYHEWPAALREISNRVEDELGKRVFMYIPPEQALYHDVTTPPFGEAVQNKFPRLGNEITEASLCMGCGRWTAAVFHLMRVMEGGLRRLVKRVNALVGTNPNWGAVLAAIDTAITGMTAATAKERTKKNKYREAYIYLANVKDAWRNPSMHFDRSYNREEATAIFESVRAFMTAMAKLI
jgi:hypothetical protein